MAIHKKTMELRSAALVGAVVMMIMTVMTTTLTNPQFVLGKVRVCILYDGVIVVDFLIILKKNGKMM